MAAAPPTIFRRGNLILLPAGAAVALSALSLGAPACGLTADFSGLQGGAPRSYCSKLPKQPAFCSDFDENRSTFPWDETIVGGELAIDSTASVSPPNSVAVQNDGSPALNLALRTPFPQFLPPPSTIDFEFSLQSLGADSLTDGPRLVIAAIDFFDSSSSVPDSGPDSGPTPNRYSLQLTLVQAGGVLTLALEEETNVSGACQYHPHPLRDPLTAGAWTDVRITVKLGVSMTATAAVSFGATEELSETPLCMSVNPTHAQIGIGSIYNSVPASIWKNRYDNVTLDVAPSP